MYLEFVSHPQARGIGTTAITTSANLFTVIQL